MYVCSWYYCYRRTFELWNGVYFFSSISYVVTFSHIILIVCTFYKELSCPHYSLTLLNSFNLMLIQSYWALVRIMEFWCSYLSFLNYSIRSLRYFIVRYSILILHGDDDEYKSLLLSNFVGVLVAIFNSISKVHRPMVDLNKKDL